MLRQAAKVFISLAASLLLLQLAAAHVTLRYPLPGIRNDFLDNVRTDDLCGVMANRGGEGAAWQLPDFNGTIVTEVQAGELLDVSWDLHYAHQGGFRIELYDSNVTLIRRWNSSDHWDCNVDSTVQNVTIRLPDQPCEGCILRFERQALEWGGGYLFKSCAVLDITATPNPCQGCSGRGTCGAAGACQCDSSPATGFFYGTHCEYENECEEDTHCGANGKCIDTGDESGPAKQCFCQAGFFGDVVTRPSGMQVRTCTRASELTLDTAALDTFGEEGYTRSFDSPEGTFSAYVAPGNDTFEFAMKAQTTSWLALGMRSVGEAAPAAATPAAAGEGAPAAGEGAPADSETTPAPSEPAPETEAPSTPGGGAAVSAPTTEPEAEGGRRRLSMRALAEDDPAPAEGDAAPAEGDAAPAEGDAATAEGAPAAEGEGSGGATTCAAVAADEMFRPGALGAGWAVTLEEAAAAAAGGGAAAEGEGAGAEGDGAPAAEGDGAGSEAPAEGTAGAETAPAGRRRMHSMPAVEAEAAPAIRRMTARRSLLQAAPAENAPAAPAEGTPDAEGTPAGAEGTAEAETGDGDYAGAAKDGKIDYDGNIVMPANPVVGKVSGGPCDGYPTTPPGATTHAMVNQDVVFAAAREVDGVQYFRVVDMFTPSRAKPLPDHVFCEDGTCGSDDIVDAIGVQVEGSTYIKYVRDVKTADANKATDVCLSEDQTYHVIFAYGQLTASATHVPDSSLEILPTDEISNQDFYKEDVLKFHGGGIGVTYDGRGSLSTAVNLFEEEAEGGACTPSTLDGFTCSLSRLGGNAIVHFNPVVAGDTSARIGVETPSDGYVAFAFAGDSPSQMIGATAVIATSSATDGEAGVYALTGKSNAAVVEVPSAVTTGPGRRLSQDSPFTVYDVEVVRDGGSTVLMFTRDFDDEFDGAAPVNALVAHGGASDLAYHAGRDAFGFALSADGSAVNIVDPNDKQRRNHAILMLIGWGALLPLGVILANTLRTLGPVWFALHRIIQIIGLALATAGVAIALSKFEGLEDDHKHRRLGLTVMVLGWLQPFNALIRPHPPKDDERKSALRWAWEIFHKGIGYVTLVLACITIFWGLELAETFGGLMEDHETYRSAYIGVLIALGVLWAGLLGFHFFNKHRLAKSAPAKPMSDGSGGVDKPLDNPPRAGGQYVVSDPAV